MDIDHADSSAYLHSSGQYCSICFYDLNYLTETGRFVDKVILQNEILPNGYDFKIILGLPLGWTDGVAVKSRILPNS